MRLYKKSAHYFDKCALDVFRINNKAKQLLIPVVFWFVGSLGFNPNVVGLFLGELC